MKQLSVLGAVALVAILSGGCATSSSFGIASDRVEVVDIQKVKLIEDYAKRTGLTVIWMRQPTKIVDRAASGV